MLLKENNQISIELRAGICNYICIKQWVMNRWNQMWCSTAIKTPSWLSGQTTFGLNRLKMENKSLLHHTNTLAILLEYTTSFLNSLIHNLNCILCVGFVNAPRVIQSYLEGHVWHRVCGVLHFRHIYDVSPQLLKVVPGSYIMGWGLMW